VNDIIRSKCLQMFLADKAFDQLKY